MRLKARFFVNKNGVITQKAEVLKFKERIVVFGRDKYACQSCNMNVLLFANRRSFNDIGKAGHVDHILARSRGGQNHLSNLQLLCQGCNTSKGAR